MLNGATGAEATETWCRRRLGCSFGDVLALLGRDTGCRVIVLSSSAHNDIFSLQVEGLRDAEVIWERKLLFIGTERVLSEKLAVHWKNIGEGVATKLNRNLRYVMELAGLQRLEVRAATAAGSYLCWRHGFVPSKAEWPRLSRALIDRAKNILIGRLRLIDLPLVVQALSSEEPRGPRALFAISGITAVPPESCAAVPIAKALLALPSPSWHGILDFRDLESRDWFETYLKVSHERVRQLPHLSIRN